MKKKDNRILLILLLAAVMAIAAGTGIYMLLVPKMTTFYTFKDSYKAGTVVTGDILAPVEAPGSVVVAGAAANASNVFVTSATIRQVLNRSEALKTDVTSGMPLMTSMLSITGGSSIEMNMSPTKIAMTVKVDNITGVTEELDAGSSVNVYVIVDGKSYLIFENMRLLEVTRNTSGTLSAATLELTNEEAELMLDAVAAGDIYFGLVNGSGYQYQPKQNLTPLLPGTDISGAQTKAQGTQKTESTSEKDPDLSNTASVDTAAEEQGTEELSEAESIEEPALTQGVAIENIQESGTQPGGEPDTQG